MKEISFLKDVLMQELIPATGCTEAGAVALAAAWAVRALNVQKGSIEVLEIEVDNNTYKNAIGAGIPGTGEKGLGFAAAMGAVSLTGDHYGLQILANPIPMTVKKARKLLSKNRIIIRRVAESKGILIRATARSGNEEALAVIQGNHDHLVSVQKNGNPFPGIPVSDKNSRRLFEDIKKLNYEDIVKYAKMVNLESLPIIRQAIEMNMHFCEEAKKEIPQQKIWQVVQKGASRERLSVNLHAKPQFITALAVEARMKGLDLPVMTCAGSGNQGLVATIPVAEIAKNIRASEENLLRALLLSYLTTIYIKAFTGILSPICGSAVAAAVGAGCGIVFLLGGEVSQIEAQIHNMVGAMAGIICDGAKSGCALKALTGVGLAVDSSYLSLENIRIPYGDGIVGKEVMDTLQNLQWIIEYGMTSLDTAIVEVMDRNV